MLSSHISLGENFSANNNNQHRPQEVLPVKPDDEQHS